MCLLKTALISNRINVNRLLALHARQDPLLRLRHLRVMGRTCPSTLLGTGPERRRRARGPQVVGAGIENTLGPEAQLLQDIVNRSNQPCPLSQEVVTSL